MTVAFGDRFSATVPGGSFRSGGNKLTFKGNAGGITSVVLDYGKERVVIKGRNVDLGSVPGGPVPLLVILTRGDDVRALEVRAVRKGNGLKY